MMKPNIEIMAPVGSYEALAAAIQAGAGSVYFGIGKLNMRSRSAKNFTLDDLRQLAETCNENGVKSYVTVNTIIYDEEMEEMHQLLDGLRPKRDPICPANRCRSAHVDAMQYYQPGSGALLLPVR